MQAGLLIHSLEQRIASGFRPVRGGHAGQKQNRHRRPHRPAMALRSGHPAQRVGQPGRNHENGKHLQIIAQRRGILKRMRAVGVEESAAVRAQHLDRFLRSDRALRDHLVGDCIHHRLAIVADDWFAVGPSLHLLRLDQFYRVVRSKFCTTPCETRTNAYTMQAGSSTQSVVRVRSTQKLPMVSFSRRAMPRMNAMASAMPTAAETKL